MLFDNEFQSALDSLDHNIDFLNTLKGHIIAGSHGKCEGSLVVKSILAANCIHTFIEWELIEAVQKLNTKLKMKIN